MKSDLDYWIALDKRKERILRTIANVKCGVCGRVFNGKKAARFVLCSKCYRKKFMDSLKSGSISAQKIRENEKAQRGGNDERHD